MAHSQTGSSLHGTPHTAGEEERCRFSRPGCFTRVLTCITHVSGTWPSPSHSSEEIGCDLRTLWVGHDTSQSHWQECLQSGHSSVATAEVLPLQQTPVGDGTKQGQWSRSNPSAQVSLSKALGTNCVFPGWGLASFALKRVLSIYCSKIKHFQISARTPGETWFY